MIGEADSPQVLVLVVEDNPANMLLAQAVLRRAGYRTLEARSAEEAIEQLRQVRPDLILLDIELPGRSGLDLTRQLKAEPTTASIAIVALTAYARDEDRRNAEEAGCDAYITKPISVAGLAGALAEVITASKGRTAHVQNPACILQNGRIDHGPAAITAFDRGNMEPSGGAMASGQ